MKAKAVKLLEKNIGLCLPGLGLSNDFLDMIPKAQQQNKK